MRFLGAWALAILLSSAGCSGSQSCGATSSGRGTCAVGQSCSRDVDCTSLECTGGVCGPGCSSSADCAAGEACVYTSSSSEDVRIACGTTCEGLSSIHGDAPGLVCENGHIVTCASAADPSAFCDVCPCMGGQVCRGAVSASRCDDFAGACMCVTPQPVGSPCTSHADCESRNCSGTSDSTSRHCEVPAGTACAAGVDCVRCDLPAIDGSLTCRQSCEYDSQCGLCLGNRTTHEFACFTECTNDSSECGPHERCDPVANDIQNRRYCAPIR